MYWKWEEKARRARVGGKWVGKGRGEEEYEIGMGWEGDRYVGRVEDGEGMEVMEDDREWE